MENLYGQDLDSGHHGSGFPLPPSRKRQLEELLKQKLHSQQEIKSPSNAEQEQADAELSDGSDGSDQSILKYTSEEQAYSQHCWNINNLPRCKVCSSLLQRPFYFVNRLDFDDLDKLCFPILETPAWGL